MFPERVTYASNFPWFEDRAFGSHCRHSAETCMTAPENPKAANLIGTSLGPRTCKGLLNHNFRDFALGWVEILILHLGLFCGGLAFFPFCFPASRRAMTHLDRGRGCSFGGRSGSRLRVRAHMSCLNQTLWNQQSMGSGRFSICLDGVCLLHGELTDSGAKRGPMMWPSTWEWLRVLNLWFLHMGVAIKITRSEGLAPQVLVPMFPPRRPILEFRFFEPQAYGKCDQSKPPTNPSRAGRKKATRRPSPIFGWCEEARRKAAKI